MHDMLFNLCVALIGSGVGCFVGAAADTSHQKELAYSGSALTLLAVIGIAISFSIANADMKAASKMKGDSYNNSGANFGHIGPINNYGKPDFVLTEDVLIDIVADCPAGIPVTVIAVGPRSALPMREAIANALIKNGFQVTAYSVGLVVPPPERPLEIEKTPTQTLVTIAPKA